MEEKTLTEKESLDLISQMIQSSKKNLEVGKNNQSLCWGYFTLALSVVIFLLTYFTQNGFWCWCWTLMFVFWAFMAKKNKRPDVVTYTDKAIGNVWKVMGFMFILTFIVSFICMYLFGTTMIQMMPLSALYVGIGVSINGILLQEKWMVYLPLISCIIAFYMLITLIAQREPTIWWHLLLGGSFIFSMIIPGHILKHKSIRES